MYAKGPYCDQRSTITEAVDYGKNPACLASKLAQEHGSSWCAAPTVDGRTGLSKSYCVTQPCTETADCFVNGLDTANLIRYTCGANASAPGGIDTPSCVFDCGETGFVGNEAQAGYKGKCVDFYQPGCNPCCGTDHVWSTAVREKNFCGECAARKVCARATKNRDGDCCTGKYHTSLHCGLPHARCND